MGSYLVAAKVRVPGTPDQVTVLVHFESVEVTEPPVSRPAWTAACWGVRPGIAVLFKHAPGASGALLGWSTRAFA